MLRRIVDSPWFYFTLAGLLAVVAIALQFDLHLPTRPERDLESGLAEMREGERPNVVFILIDTLRAHRMSSYGYPRETSPLMDRLARLGARFEHVQAQSSWTKASMASLWLAEYPERTGVLRFSHAIPEEARMPAEILEEAGYYTAGIFRNGWVDANFGFDQGFDLYVRPPPRSDRSRRSNPSGAGLRGTDEDVTNMAIEFLESHGEGEKPFFLYLHYMDVHQYVYDEISSLFGSSYSDAYDNAIHWTDRNVGLLMDELDKRGLFDDTLVVIASDHGEAFHEHGTEGHAKNLYREVTEVPLLFSFPFRLEEGVEVPDVASNVDVWPTIFDLLGIRGWEEVDGRSLVPALRRAAEDGGQRDGDGGPGPGAFADRPVFMQLDRHWGQMEREPRPMVAVVDGPYRLIHHVKSPERLELYDRSVDPRERRNIAAQAPDVAEELQAKVEAHLAQATEKARKAPEVEVNEMRKAQLRALGYAVGGRQQAAPEADEEEGAEEPPAEEAP